MQNSKQIQWFPGHMTKAKRQMEENLKKVDFVIEIRDARMPWSSQNPMLDEIVQKKPRLIVLSKKDKADPIITQQWIDFFQSHENIKVLALNLVKNNYKKDLVQASQELCKTLIEKQKQRGIRPRALRAMVCGIPNVGKSTMINTLARRKAAQTGDRPGVTKSLQWIRLGQDLELLDTPGVLWPKFENQEIGLRLALLGSIRDEVLSLDDLAMFGISWLMEHKPEVIHNTYGIEIQERAYDTLLEIGKKRGYLQKGNVDENRLMKAFVKDLRDNKCGSITWELPGEQAND